MRRIFTFLVLAITFFNVNAQVITETMGVVSATTSIATHESNDGFDNVNLTYSGSGDVRNSSQETDGTANILMNATNENLTVSGLSTTATSIEVVVSVRKSTNAQDGTDFIVEYSTDGSSFTGSQSIVLPTGSGTTQDYYDYTLTFSSVPTGIVAFRFKSVAATEQFRLGKFVMTPTGGVLLPVEMSRFSVKCRNFSNFIQFSTSSETNNDYFTVERSRDGLIFKGIGTIDGAGTSTVEKNYSFVDDNPASGNNYYRIKQTDFDGSSTYSKITIAVTDIDPNNKVFYNGYDKRLYYTSSQNQILKVFNLAGKLLVLQEVKDNGSLSLDNLPKGMYVAQFDNKGFVHSIKFFIH